jgi:hypothetical protein
VTLYVTFHGKTLSTKFNTGLVVMPEGIELNTHSAVINVGQRLLLKAVVTPENAISTAVVWRSSNTGVATVSDAGLVRAVGIGTAIITAETVDGKYADTCKVSVKNAATDDDDDRGSVKRPSPSTESPSPATISANDGAVMVEYTVPSGSAPTLTLSDEKIAELIEKASDNVVLDVSNIPDAEDVALTAKLFAAAAEAGKGVEIIFAEGSVTFGKKACGGISESALGKSVTVSVKRAEADLNAAQAASAGANPVFEVSVSVGGTVLNSFAGNIEIRLPYTLGQGEDPNTVVVYSLDEQGNMSVIKNCVYSDGMIIFVTDRLAKFVIATKPVAFTDVAGHWAQASITKAGARGLVTGYEDG